MKDFKLGGYYVLLDRTAFFTDEIVINGHASGVPAGTVVRAVHIGDGLVNMMLNDGVMLFTTLEDRSKFRPVSNKQIAQYRKERAVALCTR